ncbi:alpha/beta hydrolase fold domain-containing protein [Nocardia sp. NPDC051570]|uniref:alpha/beta hydrolase n=1 Tax=Nocardia sp. NPDC051570 TaxID=3364324 RepID=UPI0037AB936B
MTLHPQTEAVLQLMTASYPDIGAGVTDAEAARRVLSRVKQPPAPQLPRVEDRAIPGAPDIPVRIYWPAAHGGPHPVIVFFHGGGFVLCGLDSHDGLCRTVAAGVPAIVISVDYRLSPEHKYPAAVEDAVRAVSWAHAHAAELGGDPRRLVVAGDSAGGNLATVTCLRIRDGGGPPIAFQLLLYPWLDFLAELPSRRDNAEGYYLTATHLRWFEQQYLNSPAEAAHPDVSPLRAESLADLPPALVLTAEYDPLRDEGEAYAARLAEAGVPVRVYRADGLFHCFLAMIDFLPGAREAAETVCAAVRSAVAAQPVD